MTLKIINLLFWLKKQSSKKVFQGELEHFEICKKRDRLLEKRTKSFIQKQRTNQLLT